MNPLELYQQWQKDRHEEWEAKCGRCGACCGAFDGDPCVHLQKDGTHYYCDVYENRFGPQKTVSGRDINCVHIRSVLHTSWPGDECCGYKKAGA